ncbi:MAG: GNAT family N-acetyltransferase [Brevibacterium sp.]
MCEGDAGDVFAAFVSNEDIRRQGAVASLDEAERYVTDLLSPEASHRPWAIAIGDRLVGLVCVSVDEVNLNGWFWYWMHADSRGKGWMSRAAATLADLALNQWGLERPELGHRVNNTASAAVAQAAGFVREGTERAKFLVDGKRIDVNTYGRLRSDPSPDFEPLRVCTP